MSPEERNEEIMKINDKDEFIMLMEARAFGHELSNDYYLRLAGVLSLDEIKSVLMHEATPLNLVSQKAMACEKKDDLVEILKALDLYDEEEFESMTLEEVKAIIVEHVSPPRHDLHS